MNFYLNVKNGKIINASNSDKTSDTIKSIDVSQDVYYDYIRYENKYIYKHGKVIVNKEFAEELKNEREERFNSQFFSTSLGYIRRRVTMQDGSIKDFLTDILPLLQAGVPILVYSEPDFDTDNDPAQSKVTVTDDFINECKQQLLKDFYGEALNENTTDTTNTVSDEVDTKDVDTTAEQDNTNGDTVQETKADDTGSTDEAE